MKLTNRLGLPEALVNAVKNDEYDRGGADISVTSLISPPRKTALEEKHATEIVEDVIDNIWPLLGQAVHTILERAETVAVTERRLYAEIEGWKVSGSMDHYVVESGLLSDYKVQTVYKFKDGKVDPGFEQQLNCYAWLLRKNGIPIKRAQIVGILRDWSKGMKASEQRYGRPYPDAQVVVQEVTLWPEAQAEAFVRERVILHKQARVALPECSPEERWAKPTQYAVMKPGNKISTKNYTNRAEAEEHAARIGARVEMRPSENTRCESYCSVKPFCSQYKKLASEKDPTEPLASAAG